MLEKRSRLLTVVFIESFASVLLERGIYFYTHDRLGFSDRDNLYLALGFGLAYVVGALASHRVVRRLGEKRTVVIALIGTGILHFTLAANPTLLTIAISMPLVAALTGVRWPIMESYTCAGMTPKNTARILGRYNACWSTAVVLGLAAVGPMIGSSMPWLLFACAGSINVVSLAIFRRVASRPTHLDRSHPKRPVAAQLGAYRKLLTSSRWSMLSSYVLLFILAPLLPQILGNLGLGVEEAAAGSALIDVFRIVAFVALGFFAIWHGRRSPLVAVVVGMPIGVFLVLFGHNLTVVLLGEALFGLMMGLAYYAALYYAMVVENASVDAGGVHEGLIGMGFAIGPAVGLIGLALAQPLGGYVRGMLAGIVPLVLVFTVAAIWPLLGIARLPGAARR